MSKITKILIANRGEIACRVMKTAREMGIGTVAVYSDADRKALHVRMADEAVHIGASPAAESYLVIDKIIAACKSSGADAVHPGYGFLSENPEFARRLKKEGIVFIGPSPESMEAMGLKDAAKTLMETAGVPVTPGYHGVDQDTKLLKTKAGEIGYPVLIKAIAGGGGKGMRKVNAAADFEDALASCMREAKSSFGDDRVLIEKYILSPRHIEVQVFGDTHGNVVHMYERDCSLQRRHQKVIEEAPAPGMSADVRAAMTHAAIEAAKAVNYVGAGTVEFIVDGSGKLSTDGFWFMEMNTRLQVEHPVTEMITGLDLVELQIRVAQGETLPKQSDIKIAGHAIEARIYAEDPANDFLPSIGKLDILTFPKTGRIDTGVVENAQVSMYYDPMIAKLTVHEDERETAIDNLISLCQDTHVWPVKTNTGFLQACLSHADFRAFDISTHFIADQFETLTQNPDIETLTSFFAKALLPTHITSSTGVFEGTQGWRLNTAPSTHFVKQINGQAYNLPLNLSLPLDASFSHYQTAQGDVLFIAGHAYLLEDIDIDTANVSGGDNSIIAPMPGKILSVNVSEGDTVTKGDKLVIMEAMKMEMSLEAPRDGVVSTINCAADTLVSDGEILVELAPSSDGVSGD